MTKKTIAVLLAGTVLCVQADFNSALDCQDLTFVTGGDARWFEQSAVVHTGETALRTGVIKHRKSTTLQTETSGNGMLAFWWRVSSERNYDVFEITVDGTSRGKISGHASDGTEAWVYKVVCIAGSGTHTICWTYSKDGSEYDGQDCGWLDAVEWIPATESMTVAFQTNGGDTIAPTNCEPGILYGDLPVPTWDGHDFGGWFLDEALTQEVEHEEPVLFNDHTLYARWLLPISALDGNGLSFSAPEEGWRVIDGAGYSGGRAAVLETEKESPYGKDLVLSVSGPGTLAFQSRDVTIEGGISLSCKVSDSYYYSDYDSLRHDWSSWSITVLDPGEQTIRLCPSCGSGGSHTEFGLLVSDFAWRPAPETVTVTFETNGGEGVASQTYSTGTRYSSESQDGEGGRHWGLPVPVRNSCDFDGWFRDAALTEKVYSSDYVALSNHVLYASWLYPVSTLNMDGISCEDPAGKWRVRSNEDGTYVIGIHNKDYIYAYTNLSLAMNVQGAGILTFDDDYYYDRSLTIDGQTNVLASTWSSYGDLIRIPIVGRGLHRLVWSVKAWAPSDWKSVIDRMSWIPASDTLTATYSGEGVSGAYSYAPGTTWGSLPTPKRSGKTFVGWYMDEALTIKPARETFLPFTNSNIYAKWADAKITCLPAQMPTPKASGSAVWRQRTTEADGTFLEVELTGKQRKDDSYWNLCSETGSVQVATAKAGWLSFDMLGTDCGEVDFQLLVDGAEIIGKRDVYAREGDDGSVQWKKLTAFVPAGKHTVKFVAHGRGVFCENGRSHWYLYEPRYDGVKNWLSYRPATLRVRNVKFEPVAQQKDLETWVWRVHDFRSWNPGDLARFTSVYKTRMRTNPDDYEARILHAILTLGSLAECKEFKTYAKTFGYTLDWFRMSFNGALKLDKKTASVNAMADKALALATPAIKTALADLEGIPDDWGGTVKFGADRWPMDEDVYIDIADVMFARSSLNAALASLNFLASYDMTADWTKAKSTVNLNPEIPVVTKLPSVDDEATWKNQGFNFRTKGCSENYYENHVFDVAEGSALIRGSVLSLRLTTPEPLTRENEVRYFDGGLESGCLHVRFRGEVYGENGVPEGSYTNDYTYVSQTNVRCRVDAWMDLQTQGERRRWLLDYATVPATITIRENALVLNVNLSEVKDFAKKKWNVRSGYVETGRWSEGAGVGDCYSTWNWQRNGTIRWRSPSRMERSLNKGLNDQKGLFSKVRNAARLGVSRQCCETALLAALDADSKAIARATDGKMHFIEYDPLQKAQIAFARENTRRVLDSLREPTAVDLAALAADVDRFNALRGHSSHYAEYDCTLLPDNGFTRIYLGAIFEGRITRDLLPKTRLNEYGEIVPDLGTVRDPTLGGLVPDMTMEHVQNLVDRYAGARDTDYSEKDDNLPVPGNKVTRTFAQYKGYAASGLPKGWKWDAKKGVLTGVADSTFTVTFTKKGKPTAKEIIEVEPKPAVLLFVEDAATVSVSGTGRYSVGATVKAVAAVKAGQAFAGWYDRDSGELVAKGASYSFKMPRTDVSLEARTIALADDMLSIGADVSDVQVVRGEAIALPLLWCDSGSPATITANGLPKGLAFGVDGDGQWVVRGVAKQDGVYYVTFNAKNNGGYKDSCIVRFLVGEAVETEPNGARLDLESFVDVNDGEPPATGRRFEFSTPVPPSTAGANAKSIKTKGLPNGLKATFANGTLTIKGVPTKAGLFDMEFIVTYADKKTARTMKKVIVDDSGCVWIPTGVIANDPAGVMRGKVSGGGVKAYGSTVKLVAKSTNTKKYFFQGWYLDEACGHPLSESISDVSWKSATVSFVLNTEFFCHDGCLARFVTTAAELGIIAGLEDGNVYNGEMMQAGVKKSFTLADMGITVKKGWTVSIAGLPKGWTWNAKKGIISGVATKSGRSNVTLTVTKGKTSYRSSVVFYIAALPEWVAGTFYGDAVTTGPGGRQPMLLTATVSAAGAASLRLAEPGGATITSASQLKSLDEEGATFSYSYTKDKVTFKGQATIRRQAFDGDVSIGEIEISGTGTDAKGRATQTAGAGWQDLFVRTPSVAGLPMFGEDNETEVEIAVADLFGTLALKFGTAGAVSAVWSNGPRGRVAGSAHYVAITREDTGARAEMVVGFVDRYVGKFLLRIGFDLTSDGQIAASSLEFRVLDYLSP